MISISLFVVLYCLDDVCSSSTFININLMFYNSKRNRLPNNTTHNYECFSEDVNIHVKKQFSFLIILGIILKFEMDV